MKLVNVVIAVVLSASISMGASFRSIPEQSKADFGATHVAVLKYSDLTASTNLAAGSYVVSNLCVLAAKQSVEMVAMVLITPFVDTATNAHNSTTMKVGDTADDDAFLTSTELNSDGTEVFIKFGRTDAAATSGTAINTTNVTYLTGVVSNSLGQSWVVVTNITAATESQTRLTALSDIGNSVGRKVYTAANNLYFTFTGTSSYAMSNLDAGEVRCYFRIKDAAVANP